MLRLINRITAILTRQGTPTLVNGQQVNGVWMRAQPQRVQIFLGDTVLQQPPYEVLLPPSVLQAPFLITLGSELTWVAMGWSAQVRALDPVDSRGQIVAVTAICVLEVTD